MACSHRPRTVTGIVHADEIAEVIGGIIVRKRAARPSQMFTHLFANAIADPERGVEVDLTSGRGQHLRVKGIYAWPAVS